MSEYTELTAKIEALEKRVKYHDHFSHSLFCCLIAGMVNHLINGISENIYRCFHDQYTDCHTGNWIQNREAKSRTQDTDKCTNRRHCI